MQQILELLVNGDYRDATALVQGGTLSQVNRTLLFAQETSCLYPAQCFEDAIVFLSALADAGINWGMVTTIKHAAVPGTVWLGLFLLQPGAFHVWKIMDKIHDYRTVDGHRHFAGLPLLDMAPDTLEEFGQVVFGLLMRAIVATARTTLLDMEGTGFGAFLREHDDRAHRAAIVAIFENIWEQATAQWLYCEDKVPEYNDQGTIQELLWSLTDFLASIREHLSLAMVLFMNKGDRHWMKNVHGTLSMFERGAIFTRNLRKRLNHLGYDADRALVLIEHNTQFITSHVSKLP